jgi:hypothetical protein
MRMCAFFACPAHDLALDLSSRPDLAGAIVQSRPGAED